MGMTRRNFLHILAGVAATPTVSYFLPPIAGWKAHPTVDPRLFDYQRRLLEVCERLSGLPQVYYCHPAQKAAIESLMPMRLYGGSRSPGLTYADIRRRP